MNNCGLNPADKQYCSRGPLTHLTLADMVQMQSFPSTSYRDATSGVLSNSVQTCGRNPAEKEVSTDEQTNTRIDLNAIVPRPPPGGGDGDAGN